MASRSKVRAFFPKNENKEIGTDTLATNTPAAPARVADRDDRLPPTVSHRRAPHRGPPAPGKRLPRLSGGCPASPRPASQHTETGKAHGGRQIRVRCPKHLSVCKERREKTTEVSRGREVGPVGPGPRPDPPLTTLRRRLHAEAAPEPQQPPAGSGRKRPEAGDARPPAPPAGPRRVPSAGFGRQPLALLRSLVAARKAPTKRSESRNISRWKGPMRTI